MTEYYFIQHEKRLVKNTLANAQIIQIFIINWEIYGLVYERVKMDHSNLYDLTRRLPKGEGRGTHGAIALPPPLGPNLEEKNPRW